MDFEINDQQLIVGQLAELDAVGLPDDDTLVSADWAAVDTTDDGTDVTVVSGDASSGTSDGNLNSVTVQATGTGEGTVAITGTLTFASGAVVLATANGTVNGGPAASASVTFGDAQAIPTP